jgi:hypothetical protein
MTVKRQGSMTGSTTISQAGSVLTISAEGVAQITARIKTDTTNILTALNSIPPGTPHPTFTTLLSREYGAVTNVGGIAELEVIYRGYTNPLPACCLDGGNIDRGGTNPHKPELGCDCRRLPEQD